MTRDCPVCGGAIGAAARFCRHCGATVPAAVAEEDATIVSTGEEPATTTCSACRGAITAGARFCRHCGATLQALPTSTPALERGCEICGAPAQRGTARCAQCSPAAPASGS